MSSFSRSDRFFLVFDEYFLSSSPFWHSSSCYLCTMIWDRWKREQTIGKQQKYPLAPLCLVSCCFMILWLSANSFFVISQLDRVQLSKMQSGSWPGIKIHLFGLLCRDYNLEIATKLLLWITLAIPTLLKTLTFSVSQASGLIWFYRIIES